MARPSSPVRSLVRLLEEAALPLYALDDQRRLIFANAALGEWLGQDPARLVGLQCNYHAGGGEKSSSELAASLCPPPEAIAGECQSGHIARPASENRPHESRPARFVWLPGAEERPGLLLVCLLAPASAAPPFASNGQISPEQLHAVLQRLRGEMGQRFHISQLIGESDEIRRVREQVRLAAAARSRVLIVGPPGSGREHVARTIHYSQPAAALGAMMPIDCQVVDAERMQSMLTSLLRRQAETPAERPPTALLLNVDRLKADAQQELVGFFQLPGIELHSLATARASLQRLAAKGKFRRDLALALSTLTIALPPLHKRAEDVPLLAQHFLEELNASGGKQLSAFAPAALDLLAAYPWPGDVEELAQAVREAGQKAAGPQVLPTDFSDRFHLALHAAAHPPREAEAIDLDKLLAAIERELLQRALAQARGNKSRAAELLGINRGRLLRRLVQLGLAEPTAAEEPVVFEPLPEEP
jgi:transcriptional regulator of acetoin/glycerol metabolism